MKKLLKQIDQFKFPVNEVNKENWFTIQPTRYFKFGSKQILISQPLSSFLVYLLGILAILAAIPFLRHEGDLSKIWWGIALLLWGVGALLAGTSYQAFGFQIKCEGRDVCRWTSWWEVIYMIFQQLSMDAILLALAYSSADGPSRKWILLVSAVIALSYIVLVLFGAFKPNKTLISFEFMVLYSLPGLLLSLCLNSWNYFQTGATLELALIYTWLSLIAIGFSYSWYLKLNISQKLWSRHLLGRKIWFTENDVLHVTLIFWVVYIAIYLEPLVKDFY